MERKREVVVFHKMDVFFYLPVEVLLQEKPCSNFSATHTPRLLPTSMCISRPGYKSHCSG